MYNFPLTRLIRIKGAELNEFTGRERVEDVSRILKDKGFKIIESSSDDVIVTYEAEYSKDGVNTWLTIGLSGEVSDVKHTIAKL